jgi:ABC-type nitrate/sulfonate/bicarbonate transport system permease component
MYLSTTLPRPAFVRAAALPLTLFLAATLASAATPTDASIANSPLTVAPVQIIETPEMDGTAVQSASCGGAASGVTTGSGITIGVPTAGEEPLITDVRFALRDAIGPFLTAIKNIPPIMAPF